MAHLIIKIDPHKGMSPPEYGIVYETEALISRVNRYRDKGVLQQDVEVSVGSDLFFTAIRLAVVRKDLNAADIVVIDGPMRCTIDEKGQVLGRYPHCFDTHSNMLREIATGRR